MYPQQVDELLVNVVWAFCSTYHMVLNSTPGATMFERDVLFGLPYIADWNQVGKRSRVLIEQSNAKEISEE